MRRNRGPSDMAALDCRVLRLTGVKYQGKWLETEKENNETRPSRVAKLSSVDG